MGLAGGGGGGSSGAIRAGRAFVELFIKDNSLYRTLDALQRRLSAVGKGIAAGGAAGVAGGTAALTPLLAAGKMALDHNTQIAGLAGKLGVSTEALSALAYAAATTGQDFDQLQGHFENFSERIYQASIGAGEGAETFRKLNLNAGELVKIPITEAMEKTLVALGGVTDETARLGMMSSLGGDKFQELAVLAKGGAAGLASLKKEAADVGAVLSGKDARDSVVVARGLNAAYAAVKSTVIALGTAMLPAAGEMKALQQNVTQGAAAVREFIAGNKSAVQAVALVGAGLIVAGTALTGLGLAFAGVAMGLAAVKALAVGAFALLTSPVVLATAAVAGLGYAFLTMTDEGRKAAADIGAFWGEVGTGLKDTFAGVANAIQAGDLELAVKVAGAGLTAEWVRVTNSVKAAWADAMFFFKDGWISAIYVVQSAYADMGAKFLQSTNTFHGTLGGNLIKLGGALGITNKADTAEMLKNIEQDTNTVNQDKTHLRAGEAEKARLAKQFQADHDALVAGRDAGQADADAKLAAAQDEARRTQTLARWKAGMARIGVEPTKLPGGGFTPEVGKAVRGAFAFGNASQVFAGDTHSVVSELTKHTALLKLIDEALRAKPPDRAAANPVAAASNVTVTAATPRFT